MSANSPTELMCLQWISFVLSGTFPYTCAGMAELDLTRPVRDLDLYHNSAPCLKVCYILMPDAAEWMVATAAISTGCWPSTCWLLEICVEPKLRLLHQYGSDFYLIFFLQGRWKLKIITCGGIRYAVVVPTTASKSYVVFSPLNRCFQFSLSDPHSSIYQPPPASSSPANEWWESEVSVSRAYKYKVYPRLGDNSVF